jgi:hypothetical protein
MGDARIAATGTKQWQILKTYERVPANPAQFKRAKAAPAKTASARRIGSPPARRVLKPGAQASCLPYVLELM